MKKLLALILAVLMLASLAIAAVSAEEEYIDFETLYFDYGIKNIYVGAPVTAAPTLDGVIGEGEYTFSRIIEKGSVLDIKLESDAIEYFAHDADFVYYAFVVKQEMDNRAFSLQFKVQNDYKYPLSLDGFYQRNSTYVRLVKNPEAADGWEFNFTSNTNNAGQPGITAPAWEEDMFVGATWDVEDTFIKVIELKITKAYFCDQLEIEKDELRLIQYYTYLHTDAQGNHQWASQYTMNTEMGLILADAGARGTVDGLYTAMILEEAPEGYYTTTEATTTAKPATTTASPEATTTVGLMTTTAPATTTKAPAADATTTAAPEKEGCKSSLAVSALVMIPTLAGGVILTSKKRKED